MADQRVSPSSLPHRISDRRVAGLSLRCPLHRAVWFSDARVGDRWFRRQFPPPTSDCLAVNIERQRRCIVDDSPGLAFLGLLYGQEFTFADLVESCLEPVPELVVRLWNADFSKMCKLPCRIRRPAMTNRNRRTRLTAKTVAAAKPGTREYTADIRGRDPVEAAIELVSVVHSVAGEGPKGQPASSLYCLADAMLEGILRRAVRQTGPYWGTVPDQDSPQVPASTATSLDSEREGVSATPSHLLPSAHVTLGADPS